MSLLGLIKKPKKKYYPKVNTTKIDQTEIENSKESELLLSIKRDLKKMIESPCYTEYSKYITNNMRIIYNGAFDGIESGSIKSIEEYVQSWYYTHVVVMLIYGYKSYADRNNMEFHPLGNSDLCLLQFLALERESSSTGSIIDVHPKGIDPEVYYTNTLVPFYERFDAFRYLELLKGERRHIEIMDAYYECKRKVSVLYPSRSSASTDILDHIKINSGYQNFINMNRDLIYDIHENLSNKDKLYHMSLEEVVRELYYMVIIKHLLRVADYNQIIHLTEDNTVSYTIEMLDICLPMNLCWMPDDRTEKEILDKFRKRVITMNTRKGISKEFKDRVFDEVFGESRRYISSIEDILTDKIYENGVIINGKIENSSTVEKAVTAIKEYIMDMMDEGNIGIMNMYCRYADNGIPAVDVIAEEIDPWDLTLHVSLPVFEKSGSISDPGELHDVLIKQLDEYEAGYAKKKHGSIKNLANDDWYPIEKEWNEFRGTGLFLIVNQFLHIFGWALVYNAETKQVKPARVRYRGFSEGSVTRAYEKVQRYMIENAQELYDESDYNDQEE